VKNIKTQKNLLKMHSGEYVKKLHYVSHNRFKFILKLIKLQKKDKLVDFASGTGLFAELIHKSISSYEGIDFSQDFISFANTRKKKLNLKNVNYHYGDIHNFCKKKSIHNKYDKVTALDFSEHIYDRDFLKYFNGAYDILKKGGALFIYTPNLNFFFERLKDWGIAKQFPEHIGVRNYSQYKNLLKKCNFKNIKLYKPPHFNIFRFLHFFSYIPFIGELFTAKLLIKCIK